ncbi:MAG: hypothetical protein ACXVIC_05635, partial [Halobacteriota archaeon]
QIITLASVTYGKVYRITYEATERFLSHCLVFPATTISHIRLIILFFPIIVTVPFWWPRMIALLREYERLKQRKEQQGRCVP